MSLIQFFRILMARRAILLAALLSCLVVAGVMTQVLPKRYAATARVWLDVIKPDPVTGQVLSNPFSYGVTQTEIIKDYQVAEKVVDRLGWANDPAMIQSFAEDGGDAGDIRRWLAKQIIDNTEATLVDASNILEIKYSSSSPEAAKQVVDLIREVYRDSSIERQRDSAGGIADWYTEQARQAEALVKAAEVERARYAKQNGIVLQADSTDLESSRLKALSSQTPIEFVAPSAPVSAAAPVSPSQTQLAMLEQQIAQAATRLGPNHPSLQVLERQRSVLQGAVARERAAIVQPNAPSVGQAASRAAAAYEQQRQRVVSQSDQIDMINRMTRDIELKREQLAKVAEKASEYRLQANAGDNEIRLMGDAIASDSAEFPNVPVILAGAIAFGAALGICLSLLVEFFGRRIRGREDLEYASKVPVLAEISTRAKKQTAVHRKLVRFVTNRLQPQRALTAGS